MTLNLKDQESGESEQC